MPLSNPVSSALASSTNQLAGNVTITNANQFYDATSLSLVAGTWLLVASVGAYRTGGVGLVTAKLWDGTTVYSSGQVSSGNSGELDQITLTAIVVLASTTTVKTSLTCQAAGVITAAATTNGAGNNAQTLIAVKIA